MKIHHALGFAIALLSSAGTAHAGQVLENGGFESPGLGNGKYGSYKTGDSIGSPGWTVLGNPGPSNRVLLLEKNFASAGVDYEPHGGQNWLDITGMLNTGTNSGVQQTVMTTAGLAYELAFFVGRAVTNDSSANPKVVDPAIVDLSINGGPRVAYTNDLATSPGTMTWQGFTTRFTAVGNSTTFSFYNGTLDTLIVGLDDVSLTELTGGVSITAVAPEPTTFASATVGILCVGLTWVSRRRARNRSGTATS